MIKKHVIEIRKYFVYEGFYKKYYLNHQKIKIVWFYKNGMVDKIIRLKNGFEEGLVEDFHFDGSIDGLRIRSLDLLHGIKLDFEY